jgi:hypothetical protein
MGSPLSIGSIFGEASAARNPRARPPRDGRPFPEEEQDPEGVPRVDEGLLPAAALEDHAVGIGPGPDDPQARGAQIGDRRVQVVDHQRELVEPLPALREEAGDRVVVPVRLEQLEREPAQGERDVAVAVDRDVLGLAERRAEVPLEERPRPRQVPDGDRHPIHPRALTVRPRAAREPDERAEPYAAYVHPGATAPACGLRDVAPCWEPVEAPTGRRLSNGRQ